MPNETKDKTTLEKLKELQENDTISSLDFEEPELKTFDVTNIFEIEWWTKKARERKSLLLAKRANRQCKPSKDQNEWVDNNSANYWRYNDSRKN